MTVARFDPRIMEAYDAAPPLLHFEFGGKVYRYVMLQPFGPKDLDADTRRTKSERALAMTHAEIRHNLFRKPE